MASSDQGKDLMVTSCRSDGSAGSDLAAKVEAQKGEIERLKAELESRDAELAKLKAENAGLRAPADPAPPPAPTGTAPSSAPAPAPAPSAPAPAKPEVLRKQSTFAGSDRTSTRGSVRDEGEGKAPDTRASQGVREGADAGKGVTSASGQRAQAAYTDYEALLDTAFTSIKEMTVACSQMGQAGVAPEMAQLVMDMGQSSIFPLEQMRLLFRSAETGDDAYGSGGAGGGAAVEQKTKRTTVSLQHLTRALQDTATVCKKYKETKPPMFGRQKFQAAAQAELKKQADSIKAYAVAMLLEHGMKPSDFDRNKKAAANAYHMQRSSGV